ncbi:MAG: hypothetical protein AAFR81_28765 [Chloroflexota bacterium]
MEHQKSERNLTDKMLTIELTDKRNRTIEQIIIDALVESRRVKKPAAEAIGISRQVLTNWIRVLKIDVDRITPESHSQWQEEKQPQDETEK